VDRLLAAALSRRALIAARPISGTASALPTGLAPRGGRQQHAGLRVLCALAARPPLQPASPRAQARRLAGPRRRPGAGDAFPSSHPIARRRRIGRIPPRCAAHRWS
jgi:hypothetical protein